MTSFIFWTGFLLVLFGTGGWLYTNRKQIFGRNVDQQVSQAVSSVQRGITEARPILRRSTDQMTKDDQVADLRAGEFVTVRVPGVGMPQEFMVTVKGEYHPQNHNGGGRFSPKSTEALWPYLVLEGKYILIGRPESWYWFEIDPVHLLGNDECKAKFDRHGEQFTDKGQVWGNTTFTWVDQRMESHTLTIWDVGYLNMDLHGSEPDFRPLVRNGMLVKYMIGEESGKGVFFLENQREGQDRVYVNGHDLGNDLKKVVISTLRAAS